MTELVIVLCVIGILMLLVLPNQTSVIGSARAIEAQSMLNQIYALEKSYFYKYGKYSSDFEEIGFELPEGGQVSFDYSIVEASNSGFKARAVAQFDLDSDGTKSIWEIDHQKLLVETQRD